MYNALKQIFLLFLIVLISACGSDELNKVEEIINSEPESALAILEEIKPGYDNMSDKDKALFGVLYFQALNKNRLDLSPVEMINFSIDYYKKKENKFYLSYSYLYKAWFLRHEQQYSEAVSLLLEALELAKDCSKKECLLGKIYYDLGIIAFKQNELEKAKFHYNNSADNFGKIEDFDNVCISLLGLGKSHNNLNDYSGALDYYHQALIICSDSMVEGTILYEIGNTYYHTLEMDSALYYINKSLLFPSTGNYQSLKYLTLAQLYFDLRENDRAVEHANLALTFPTDFYIQRECYVVLTNVSFIKNDKEKTALYLDSYMAFVDSVIKLESQPRISVLEEVHSANRELNKLQKNRYIFVCVILLLILVSGIFFYSIYRNKIVKTGTK